MPMVLNSPMVGDWKSLLSNFGGTGPVPTTGRPLLEEGVVGILVIGGVGEGLEDAAVAVAVKGMEGERLAAEAVVGEVVVAGGTGGADGRGSRSTGSRGNRGRGSRVDSARKSGRRARLCLPRPLPSSRFCVPAARARPVCGGLKKRSLTALLDRGDRCQSLVVGRLLASASERRPSLCKVHQLLSILPDATEMVGLRHVQRRARNREFSRQPRRYLAPKEIYLGPSVAHAHYRLPST